MTVGSLYASVRDELGKKFNPSEANEISLLIFESLKNWSLTDILVRQDEDVSDFIAKKADSYVRRTLEGEPIQYIIGFAHFYGMRFKVTTDTLIPRPETTELVDIIVKKYRNVKDLRVADIGAGSGCIAISLARNLKFPDITAIDISDNALIVAKENAKTLKADVIFEKSDILSLPVPSHNYDIIVSNPPYITLSEAQYMDANVLEYEPASALFVPDNDPLRFYSPTIDYAVKYLNDGGGLFFEVNPRYAIDIRQTIESKGFGSVDIINDISAKKRFVCATK